MDNSHKLPDQITEENTHLNLFMFLFCMITEPAIACHSRI